MKDENKEEILSTEQQVWDVLQYAQSASGLGSMPISIDMLNQAMKAVSLGHTGEVTEQNVSDALADPKNNEDELRRISQSFDITSSIYKRLLSYMGNLPSWDYTFTCTNIKDVKDYKKPSYKKDLKVLENFMQSFDHKQEFSKVIKQMWRNEAYFSVFRDDGEKFVLQELPQEYCTISGKFSHGLLFSFDYQYFLKPGVNIDFYPAIFKKTLAKLQKNKVDPLGYNPSDILRGRGNHGFVLDVDCSPIDGNFWMWKFSPEIIARIPYFAGLFPDLVNQDQIRELQKSSYISSAVKLLTGKVPLLTGKASVKDALSISPDLLGKFMALVQASISSTAVKIAATPLEDMKGHDFKSDPDISSSFLKNTLAASGVSSNLLFSQDTKLTVLEAGLAMDIDIILATSVYPQFQDFLNWQINSLTSKFKFDIKLHGSTIYTDRERRLDSAMELAQSGIVLPQRIASGMGMSPFELERELDMGRESGFVDKLTPILQSGQISKEDGAGAPVKKDKELSEEGSDTRANGGNLDKDG